MRRRGGEHYDESNPRNSRKKNGLQVVSIEAGNNTTSTTMSSSGSSWFREDCKPTKLHVTMQSEDEPIADVMALPMVDVISPTSLPENYQFPASLNGTTFLVTVPRGGVHKGQRFSVPFSKNTEMPLDKPVSVPKGQWRDQWYSLFRLGICHPTVWNSCCCLPIAIGQLITRLQLSLRGRSREEHPRDTPGSFRFFFRLVCSYWVYRFIMFWFVDFLDPSTTLSFDASKLEKIKDREPPGIYYLMCAFNDLVWYCYFGCLVFVLKNIRSHVRKKYSIPEQYKCPVGSEDICCSLFCPCFTAAQLLRHTTDYELYEAAECCSDTGLPFQVPAIVVWNIWCF